MVVGCSTWFLWGSGLFIYSCSLIPPSVFCPVRSPILSSFMCLLPPFSYHCLCFAFHVASLVFVVLDLVQLCLIVFRCLHFPDCPSVCIYIYIAHSPPHALSESLFTFAQQFKGFRSRLVFVVYLPTDLRNGSFFIHSCLCLGPDSNS